MTEQPAPSVLESLWRFRWLSILIVAAVVALSVGAGHAVAPKARATATIALTTPRASGVLTAGTPGDATLARYTAQRSRYVTSDAVMQAVAAELGRDSIVDLRGHITATPSGSSNIITITAEADDRDEAVTLAAAVIRAYSSQTEGEVQTRTAAAIASITQTEQQVLASLGEDPDGPVSAAAAETISDLQLQASALATDAVLFGDGVEWITAPRAEAVAEAGPPLREVGLGLVLGLVIAATIAWLRADRDRGVNDALGAEPILEAPLLGELRTRAELRVRENQLDLRRMPSHDFQLVWSSLLRLVRREPAGVLLVNSTDEPGRTSTALSVAVAAARDNLTVLLVDADIERGTLTRALGVPRDGGGLLDLLQHSGDYRERTLGIDVDADQTLWVLPVGANPGADLNVSTQVVEDSVAAWRRDFDLVVIDAAPIGTGQLSSVLSGAVDRLLVVVGNGADERALHDLRRRVSLTGTPVIGYVFAAAARRRLRLR